MTQLHTTPEFVADKTPDWYSLLQVAHDCSYADIEAAYQRQLTLYDPAQARLLGSAFMAVAEERRAALDEAFALLRDPRRRFAYDEQLGLVGDEAVDRGIVANRGVIYAVAGIFAALLVTALLWPVNGRVLPSGPAVAEVNYPAPPFVLGTLNGGRFDLAAQQGKVVLVNFWATWCVPCREETPALAAAYRNLEREGLVIVGVDLFDKERAQGQGEADVRQFVDQYGVTYPVVLDATGEVAREYRISPIPTSYFIDQTGNVRYVRVGRLTTADVENLFRRLQSASRQEG